MATEKMMSVEQANQERWKFLFKMCGGEQNREPLRQFFKSHNVTFDELPPNKFVCEGSPALMFNKELEQYGMSQDWTSM